MTNNQSRCRWNGIRSDDYSGVLPHVHVTDLSIKITGSASVFIFWFQCTFQMSKLLVIDRESAAMGGGGGGGGGGRTQAGSLFQSLSPRLANHYESLH